jgi:outer membrane protein
MSASIALMRVVGAFCVCAYANVFAWQAIGELDTSFDDPLKVRPLVLQMGSASLPGDMQLTCTADIHSQLMKGSNEPLSLSQSVDIALCNNPLVQTSWASLKFQTAALGEAKASSLPAVNISVGQSSYQTSYPGSQFPSTSSDTTTSNAAVKWRLFDYGGNEANQRSAAALLGAALSNHDATLQKTLLSVVGAYFDAQVAHANLVAKQSQERLSKLTHEAVLRKEARSASSLSDSLQANAALAKASLERSRAMGVYKKALSVLVHAIGLPLGMKPTLAIDSISVADGAALHTELQDWLQEVQAKHPAIRAARMQLTAATHKVEAARSEGKPTLDFGLNYYENGRPNQAISTNRSQETQASLTLNIPLFTGFGHTYRLRGAQAQMEQSQAQVYVVRNDVLVEVVKAHSDAEAAIDNLSTSELLLNAARAATESVQRKYEIGVIDILEVLNAQSAFADAQSERLRALADFRSARLRLLAVSGVINRSAILH